ncbi:aprataxin and PNK-like factor isoform X4 [Drosophila teissieri]|uniref:aprataxin and PNK-like factor isoform X4 n=1 Tax=Drosophila teissieri TaxID=7243 RepID=UPI001CBA5B8C|nr:aprataxin and PNK-like factor isoform X4 [Drosophila teissieri]
MLQILSMLGEIQLIEVQKLIRATRTTGDQISQRPPLELQLVLTGTLAIAVTQFTSRITPIRRIVTVVNSAQNIRNRLRQRRAQRQNDDDSCTDEEDEPFGGDNDKDADYRPGADIDEDEDDDLEFDSQRISGDDFD